MKTFYTTIIGMLCVAILVGAIFFGKAKHLYAQSIKNPSFEIAQAGNCPPEKYCSRMRSCTEAFFHFKQCGYHKRDGDNDGIPCEKLCGKTRSRMKQLLDAGL